MRVNHYRQFPRYLGVVLLFVVVGANAQNFGSPEEERKRLAQMSADVEKIYQITNYLTDTQRIRTLEVGPADKAPRRALENLREESDVFTMYIELFRDLHGASVVLINSFALGLRVNEGHLTALHMGNICIYMPGKASLLTSKKIPGDRSVPSRWASFGQETLRAPDLARVTEGLEIADRLSDSYNRLCDRAIRTDNWKK